MKTAISNPIVWIQSNKDKLIKLIQDLVRIPSVIGKEKDVQDYIYKKFKELDLNPKFINPDINILRENDEYFPTTSFVEVGYENRPNVTGLMKGNGEGRSICLSGHIDTVSPEPLEQWTHDPWSGKREGDLIYGRGAGDMKAGVAAHIIALQALKETQTKLKGDIFIETTIEEEGGGIGGVLYMRLTQPKTDAAIITEPTHLSIGIACAGVLYFKVSVSGVPAHAATAHFGVNAILKMTHIINALNALHIERQKKISYPYAEMSPEMKGKATTLNIGVIKAGDWPSTVPALCELQCRIGYPPGETKKEVIDQVERTILEAAKIDPWLKDHLPKVEWFGFQSSPHEMNPEHPFVKMVEKQIKQHTGIKPPIGGGAAADDSRFFGYNGIPVVVFGPSGQRGHSIDENVSISSTLKVAEIITSIIMEWCGENK